MQITLHAGSRMNTRGISKAMIELAYAYGIDQGDKVILTKKMAQHRRIEAKAELDAAGRAMDQGVKNLTVAMFLVRDLTEEIDNLGKIVDKHGLTVVVTDNTLLTTYRYQGKRKLH